MAFNKCECFDGQTVITAKMMNDIQDAICGLEGSVTELDGSLQTLREEVDALPEGGSGGLDHMPTPEEIGAHPNTWMPTAEEVGARPDTWTPTAAEIGARPDTWTPSAADVGARPSNWLPTPEEIGARPSTWMPSAADVGAAPSGFGLGNLSPKSISGVAAMDAATANGWYYVTGLGGASFAGVPVVQGLLFVLGKDGYHTRQYLYPAASACVLYREMSAQTWGEWCCENPPMTAGIEYRTTERWQGKSVYTTTVDLGNLPNNNTASVTHGRAVKTPIRCVAVLDDSATIPYDAWGSRVSVCATTASIVVATSYDASHLTARAQMWYTKD